MKTKVGAGHPPLHTAVHRIGPPWSLTGNGYVFLYRLDREFVLTQGFVPETLRERYVGGPGLVMLVDYHRSEAGPYRELLFSPGRFRLDRGVFFSITKIYVSSMESVINGRENWGIPKELAHFDWKRKGEHETIVVERDEALVAQFELRSSRFKLPVTTSLLPKRMRTVAHPLLGKTFYTTLRAKGHVCRAALLRTQINGQLFPDVAVRKPFVLVQAEDFLLQFPVPVVVEGEPV